MSNSKVFGQCNSTGNTSYATGTRRVIFNTIDNSTPEEYNAYSDFTSMSTNVGQTGSYDLTVNVNTDGNYTVHTLVWIDWNQDLDFDDAGETYDLGTARNVSNSPTTLSPISITIPGAAALGSTTMRVSTKYNSDPSACETGFDGEVEDYSINVTTPPNPEMDVAGNSTSIFDGDTSPSVNDDTYFGSADIVSGSVSHIFTISNSGNSSLDLGGNPIVAISGSHAADFTVTAQPANNVSAGSNSLFHVSFDPSASGARNASVSISNNDADENPYTFDIQGTGTAVPEIDIQGNGTSISDGDTSPSGSNDTDFSTADIYGGANTHTFTIHNSGSGALSLSGTPLVAVSGSGAAEFIVSQQPASSTVAAQGGTQTFQVTFDPTATGLRQATISVTNDDGDESPYTFAVQGTGTINPEIDIKANGVSIADDDFSPTVTDSTDFGSTQVGDDSKIVTFTIYNTGPATLNLTGSWPLIEITGTHAGDFSVHTAPSGSIAPGGNSIFQIAFDPITSGDRSAILTINNNDLNEDSYSFAIEGTGSYATAPLSEIDVQGNLISIPDGDNSPSSSDGTDLGSVAVDGSTTSQTFTIDNNGTEDLLLTSSPVVTISGVHAADFTISQQPSSPIAPSGTVSFVVVFDPSNGGTRSAYVSIENNDADESPYTFTLQGEGATSPEIKVTGNNLEIVDGDASPSLTDSTYFGDVTASLGINHVTYTIHNLGSTTLNLTGTPLVNILGDAAAEYAVTSLPSSAISAGGSTTFTVSFDPNQVGLRNASLSIASDDADENPYSFAIQGNGTGPGSPLACVPNFFHIFGDNGTVTYLDASTNPYSYTTIAVAGYHVNGMGYNLEDGLLYGFEMDGDVSGDNIVRIDGQGTITVLSSITIPYLSWRADFNDSGEMYFWDDNGDNISVFDASTGTVTSQNTGGTDWLPIDMAYLNDDGHFYGIHVTTLYDYDPVGNSVSTSAITGRLADEYSTGTNSIYYGAAWSANDGYIYTTNSQSGRMYKINVSSGESVFVGQAEANLNKSDGASCPLAESPLPTTGSVGDKVWIDTDGDGIQDAGEPGLSGVTVSLYGKDNPFIASTTTDENGEYLFENLSPSEYYIIFSAAPAGFSFTLQNQGSDDVSDSDADPADGRTADFFVGVGSIEEGMDAGFTATGVGDFVWLDTDEDGIQDTGEAGIPGIDVEIKVDGGASVATTTTDASGFYFFTNLNSGTTYRLYFTNIPAGYVFSPQDAGSNDALDSDSYTSDGRSHSFSLSSGEFNSSLDAGLYQNTNPEMNVTGNSVNIPDGDTTPGTADHTDFGAALISGSTVVRTFTIENISGPDLTLNGTPLVSISGDHASDFSLTTTPATTVSSGNNTTFQITFDPSEGGLRSAVLTISNTDADENPYDFNIQGTGLAPEIVLKGRGVLILDGDDSPSTLDSTDLGSADVVSGTNEAIFSIINYGSAALTLTGASPYVVISGSHAAEFTITEIPTTPIADDDSTTFTVRFNPTADGLRTATLSIANSDTDEDPYTFDIQGTGTSYPEMEVLGGIELILDGSTSPSAEDLTDFGSQDIFADQVSHTFTINNTGSGALALSGLPIIQITGVNAGDFLVAQQPPSATLAASGTVDFQITFDPTTTGVRSATITIQNDDDDENPYNFAIKGLGTSTLDEEIEVLGNGNVIDSGDNLPSQTDYTDLGTANISGVPTTSPFVIRNIGYETLNLTGPPPYVDITGANASEFSITSSPATSIAIDSATTTFEVTFTPAARGIRQATISIQNNDSDENPYTFAVQGTGIYDPNSQSEMNVQGNMIDIPDGDPSPDVSDGTNFGSVEVVGGFTASQNFVIHNYGSDDLVLGETPIISITGTHAADFTVTAEPAPLVAPSSSVILTITFDPSGTESREATVSIGNSDQNENPYTFDIQGTGTTAPEMLVSGNSLTINNGDSSPSMSDSTYLGDVDANLGTQYVTYTISNSGSSALNLTGTPKVTLLGDHAADFSVTTQPSSPVNSGSNTTFTIAFDPAIVGLRNASVSITSNDTNESPYTFAIQGNGTGPGSPIACVPNFFQIYDATGIIAYLDATTSPYTYTTIATAGYPINAVGYNLEDGLLYGFERGSVVSGDYMVRIDANGDITVLSSITIPFSSWVGDFNGSGDLYFLNPGDKNQFGIFDVSSGSVTTTLASGGDFLAADMAYLDNDGNFYGVSGLTLYIYNPVSNTVSTQTLTGKLADDLNAGTNGNAYGAAWSASDGYVYVSNNTSGLMYKVNITSYETVYVGQAVATNQNDAASCPLAESPLPTTGTLGNKVWLDSDGDGIQDAGEAGFADVTVSLYDGDDSFLNSVVTGSDGAYVFENLAPSEYYLTFTNPPAGFTLSAQDQGADDEVDSDADPSTAKTATFTISAGSIDNTQDAGFKATGVGDYVWLDVNEDGIQDAGESGVPGIDVEIKIDGGGASVATTTTDASGYYSFSGLSNQTYRLYFTGLPAGYVFSPQDAGSDDALDSDTYTSDGRSHSFTLTTGVFNSSLDAGVYQQSEPEIDVKGNNVSIVDGDTSPTTADHTDFGSVDAVIDSVIHTFQVLNISGADLTLNGSPKISISGTHADEFVVTSDPGETIVSGENTSFDIRFIPTVEGLRTASVSIANTDADENPYTFDIRGFGLASEIEISGNGIAIANGDTAATASDHTDFGTEDIVTGSQAQIFTILNTGNANLILNDPSPHVVITGDHPADFSITSAPLSPVASNNTTTFTVTFDPTAEGIRKATISLANNDLNEDPYTFIIQGIGSATPEIEVQGNGESIANGDSSPITSDSTAFGSLDILTGTSIHTFTLLNTGSGTLSLTGTPLVVLSGTHAGDFLVNTQPASSSVNASGGSVTFDVTFDPTSVGQRDAVISIANDDDDENPFTFSIQGTGVASSEINLIGNSLSIISGDITPSVLDSTVFDSTIVDSAFSVGFTIENQGSAALNLSGSSPFVTFSGAHAGDFSITQIPDAAIAAGGGTTEFRITFTPSAEGNRTATVNIASDDDDENPYTFAITGFGEPMPLPELTLSKSVDLATAAPGDTLTYTVVYSNVGEGLATSVVVIEDIPVETTYVENTAVGINMTIEFSHDNGTSYDVSQSEPVTNIRFTRTLSLPAGSNGTVTFKAIVD
ncbi:MAG: choice-of-anchor D domain-containing protein [Candidatus Marinimicrobia bacterium]|nr:choice-of-anchor D domain-containing protein [Candidatus Neomarinimicrobiota bacterium]